MHSCETTHQKQKAIFDSFKPLIGRPVLSFDTAEMKTQDNTWENWFGLPIRLRFQSDTVISVSWSHFDMLWVSNDTSLPFPTKGIQMRWQSNHLPQLSALAQKTLKDVQLGKGEMSIGEAEFEIWTRLILKFDDQWLEIYNNLDGNAYAIHDSRPEGVFISCV